MPTDTLILGDDAFRLPHADQYLGVWACEQRAFQAGLDVVRSIDWRYHAEHGPAAAQAQAMSQRGLQVTADGVAVISLHGVLMKTVGSMTEGTSTVLARRQLRQAADDGNIRAILLHIDSPGGTVAGSADLADEIARAASIKPTEAYIEDLGASAAYMAASQATRITANAAALVGSIGVYTVVNDLSGLAAREGIKVHVVRYGDMKGAGVPGTEVTPAQLEEIQRIVNGFGGQFVEAVASGRKIGTSRAQELADGRVHIAGEALQLGLIDAVASLDATLQRLASPEAATQQRTKPMTTTTTPAAATYADLVAACAGIDPSEASDALFLTDQLRIGATVDAAQRSWMQTLRARIEEREREAKLAARVRADDEKPEDEEPAEEDDDDQPAEEPADDDEEEEEPAARRASSRRRPARGSSRARRPKQRRGGVAGLGRGTGRSAAASADPISAFEEAVAEKVQSGMTRAKAIRATVVEDADRHAAYLEAYATPRR